MSKGGARGPRSAEANRATAKAPCAVDEREERAGKKRTRFYKRMEKQQKAKKGSHLPPKDAQGFSANWKILFGDLKSKHAADSGKRAPQKGADSEARKPPPATNKDETPRKVDNGNKTGRRPQQNVSDASPGVRTESPEEARAQQNGKGPVAPKQRKAEKRNVKDGEGGQEKRITKKKKVEEAENPAVTPDIWFDDVDPDVIEATLGSEAADIMKKKSGIVKSSVEATERSLVKEHSTDQLTRTVAIDCEMVGVGPGGDENMLARVSIVNLFGKCLYDKYVKPTEKVTDYRTPVSGIRPADIENGEDITTVQKEVADILQGRILVGHALHNDLKILLLDHPKKHIRDTQKYKPFKKIAKSPRPALRVLCQRVLNVKVQQGEHSSVQDAQATMRLYTLVKKRWEAELKASRAHSKGQKSSRQPEVKS